MKNLKIKVNKILTNIQDNSGAIKTAKKIKVVELV